MEEDANCTPEVRRSVIHRGTRFDYYHAVYRTTDGRDIVRQYIHHPGAVVILPLLEADGAPPRVVLIRNYRVSLDGRIWELPAGTLEHGEDPAACAARELVEETGYRASLIEPLGRFFTSPGLSDELMWVFVARQLEHVGSAPEPGELMSAHPQAWSDVWGLIEQGGLQDCKSLAAILLALRRGVVQG